MRERKTLVLGCKLRFSHRSQANESARSAGHRTSCAGCPGCPDGLFHRPWTTRLGTGSHKACYGTP